MKISLFIIFGHRNFHETTKKIIPEQDHKHCNFTADHVKCILTGTADDFHFQIYCYDNVGRYNGS